jgi:glutamyl-tRNA synthetase
MSADPVITRFAPSPTGELHLGNARTALYSYLLARQRAGQFVLRIEDTDAERSRDDLIAALCEELRWLGLEWDEGPDRPGPRAPYRQSQRTGLYQSYFAQLERSGAAYPCFCTPLELQLARQAQLSAGRPPRYAGTCRELPAAERATRLAAGRACTLRFRVPPGRRIEFVDLVHGTQSFASDDLGDFVIRREDGSAAFLFSNAVDDASMHITHVLRGADHLTNTPLQLLLLEALGLAAPSYGHLSLLIGPDGKPLAKRHGASSVRSLREAGYASLAVCNLLYRLGHFSASNELLTLNQMAGQFDLGHLQRASAHLDPTQLRHWQGQWVRSLSMQQAREWIAPLLPAALSAAQAEAFVTAVLPNVVVTDDIREWVEVVFGDSLTFEEPALRAAQEAGPDFFAAAAAALAEQPGQADLATLRRATGRRGAAFFLPLRAALTGRVHGPELAPLLAAMPPERTQTRLLHFARRAA